MAKPVRVPTDVKDDAVTLELSVVPVRVAALAVTVMLAEPSKEVPLIVLAVARAVAEDAVPVRFAVIVPAAKFPDASRATIVEAPLAVAAVVAEFRTLPAVEIVARYESAIVAVLDRTPEPLVRTIPAVVSGVVIVPVKVGDAVGAAPSEL
jgi:pyrrolidone-carboxylate peptidase